MRCITLGLAIGAIALAGAASADGAGERAVAGTVSIIALDEAGGQAFVQGTMTSANPACVPNRLVRVKLVLSDDSTARFDTARTGGKGGWMAVKPAESLEPDITAIKAKVPKRKVKVSKSKTIVCGGDGTTVLIGG